ncbi:MAG: type II toxin-antitoxin system RelE/ParE family toxin [Patescibacteria group bacterium]|nr:type II toxin-antitoxin system RelE/ParE family toxin [Patescibacteria group bacterium]
MKVTISPRAEKQFKKISKIDQIAVSNKIRNLKECSQISRAEKLKGYKNIYRVRVGDFRIVYRKLSLEIYIVLIGHRKDIYTLLRGLVVM